MKQYLQIVCFITFLSLMLLLQACYQQILWQNTEGPYKTKASAIVTGANGLILAGTNTGIYRSTDNGNTWGVLQADFWSTHYSMQNSLAIAKNGFVFAKDNEGIVYRSTNNGNSWTSLQSALNNTPAKELVFSTSGDIFVFVDSIGILRSTDHGDIWTRLNHMLPVTRVHSFAVDSTRTMLIAADTSVYRSIDNGRSWTTIFQGLKNKPTVFTFNSQGHIFAGGYFVAGIYHSTDNGNNWTICYQVRRPHPITRDTIMIPISVWNLTTNSQGHIFANNEFHMIGSTNDGNTWSMITDNIVARMRVGALSFAINSNNEIYIGTFSEGILRSTNDGDDWTAVSSNFYNMGINALAINSDGHIFAGSNNGLVRSTGLGNKWVHIEEGLPLSSSIRSLAINSHGDIFVGIPNGVGIYRSTNNGDNWTFACRCGFHLAIDSGGTLFTGAGMEVPYVFRSMDNGATWTRVDSGLMINPLSFAFNDSGHIFASSVYGTIFRSTNNCATWTELQEGLTQFYGTTCNINTLAIKSNGYIYAATDVGLYRSTNNGDNWEKIDHNLPPTMNKWGEEHADPSDFSQVRAIVISSHGDIFVGYDRGVYMSRNDGETWKAFNQGLPLNTIVNTLALDPSGYLYAGTDFGTVFRSAEAVTAVKKKSK